MDKNVDKAGTFHRADESRPDEQAIVAAAKHKIALWLTQYLSNLTDIPVSEIDADRTFDCYGLDSYLGVVMTHDLGVWLQNDINPTDAFDHPSANALAEFLAKDPAIQAVVSGLDPTQPEM